MNTATIFEWIGYFASGLIVISMLMTSILKLRLINLAGSALFSLYGFLIGALPVGFLNLFIVLVNVFFLTKIFSKKEYFTLLAVRLENRYLHAFTNFYKPDIKKFFPSFNFIPEDSTHACFILRDMAVAGVFLGKETREGTIEIQLDYVIKEYRDFKPGLFLYQTSKNVFINLGFNRLVARPESEKQEQYYQRMGFLKNISPEGNLFYELNLKY